MQSGNYLIGNHHIELSGFDEHVLPKLEVRGLKVTDRLSVRNNNDSAILVAITGNYIPKMLNETLLATAEELETRMREIGTNWATVLSAYAHQLFDSRTNAAGQLEKTGKFETIGEYQSPETASKLFPSIAQNYLVSEAEATLENFEESLRGLSKRSSS